MLAWSTRLLAIASAALLILTTVHLSRPTNSPLPWPLADILFAILIGLCVCALVVREASRLHARLDEVERRDGLLYAQAGRVDFRLRQLTDGPTRDLGRPQLAAVGRATPHDETGLPGYARGFVDGLARQPMAEDAKVIPMERSS
jgi:hypothetical protein